MSKPKTKIEAGDRVQVVFSTHNIIGKVLYVPVATGDSWRIMKDSGQLAYVQQFDYMVLLPEKYPIA